MEIKYVKDTSKTNEDVEYIFGVWYPIESAPRDGTSILVYTESDGIFEAWFEVPKKEYLHDWGFEYSGSVWVCLDDKFRVIAECNENGYHDYPITHWMPLPNKPE